MLDNEWKKWVNINLDNRCSLLSMYTSMTESGLREDDAIIGLTKELHKVRYKPLSYMTHTKNKITVNEKESKELKIPIVFRCGSPEIIVFSDFLSDEECNELIEHAKTRMTDSKVISKVDGSNVSDEGRTSQNAFYQRGEIDIVKKIEERISKLLNISVEQGEGLQVLNYGVGKQYKPHFDYFNSNNGSSKHLANGGQRIGTFIMYLNDVEEGGTTSFPELEMSVYPKKGNALFFTYTNNQFQCDDRSLHAGDPVISGTKWIATKWLRERAIINNK